MNFSALRRLTLFIFAFCVFCTAAAAQQRPLLTEDPRVIAEGSVVTEAGFGYQHQAHFPVSGLTGDLYSILLNGLHFGVGKRAEFQMTGTLHNYLSLENGAGSRNDWGDLAISTKIQIVDEGRLRPIVSFRPTVVLPNSNPTKGIGTDGTHFFGDILVGKKAGSAFIFGTVGLGILDDAAGPQSQNDVFSYGIAATVPVGNRVNVLGEWNGYYNAQNHPSPGGESRGQVRLGLQFKRGGTTWDVAATAGTTHLDHKAGVVAGMTKEFSNLWR
jgi:hypothetical protein